MNARQTERKVNAIVDEILDEDQDDFDTTRAETCPGDCEKLNDTVKEVSYAHFSSNYFNRFFLKY